MATSTVRSSTENQIVIDYNSSKFLVGGGHTFVRRDYANISGALESLAECQVMGRVTVGGKVVPCVSTAEDGSQYPIGFNVIAKTDVAIAGTIDDLLIVNGGGIRRDKIVLTGTDTLDTVVDGRTIEDWLITNCTKLEIIDTINCSTQAF